MDHYFFRLRFLFVPVVLFSLAVIAAYFAVCAVLVEWSGWIAIGGELLEFWLPFGVGLAAMATFLGPRLRIFLPAEKGNPNTLFILCAALLIIPPIMVLQPSLQETMWGLRPVSTLTAIPADSNARYYAPQKACVNVRGARWNGFAHSTGSSNDIAFELYAAVPVCGDGGATRYWVGIHRSHTVRASMPRNERVEVANAFERETRNEVETLDPSSWAYVERLRSGSDRHQFDKAIGAATGAVIVVPRTEPFGVNTQNRLVWAAWVFGGAAVLWAFVLLFRILDEDEVESVQATGKLTAKPKSDFSLWLLVVPSRTLYGPAVLFDLIIGVFAAMVFSGLGIMSFQVDDLVAWGANRGPLGLGPGHLGLVTSMFLHGGLMHMVNNLYGLLFAIGCLVPVARNSRLILCFLICGVAGSVASVWWNPAVIGVGASGAVLGLWGMAVALAVLRDDRIAGNERYILINIAIFGGMTALLGALSPNIDNAAHVGGFLAGLMIGVVLFVWEKISPDPENQDTYQGLTTNLFKAIGKPVR